MKMLDNAGWGFESNCFVCERANPQGLQIPFAHDDAGEMVVAEFNLGSAFSGAPTYVHGGVVSAVLDEAMAWAAIAVGGSFAVTSELSVRFERPVRVDRAHRVKARLLGKDDRVIQAEAHIVDERGRICAIATATLVPLGLAHAADAVGAEVTGDDAAFVTGNG
jgi:uncharacterized protein (TIGR00369 family)